MNIFKKLLQKDSLKVRGSLLIGATILGNFFNFAYNAYLGRAITIEDFALISLIGSFLGLADIPINALGRSMTHKSAYLLGRYKKPASHFWMYMRKKSMTISLGIAFLWVLLVPFMQGYFHLDSALPLLAVAPIWIFGILSSVDGGYIKGNLKFGSLAIVSVLEALIRFVVVFILAQNGFGKYVYVALPISSFSTFACVAYLAKKLKKETKVVELEEKNSFPYKFFATTALTVSKL
jgi:O-antigen/teichoic acid export membrane protein